MLQIYTRKNYLSKNGEKPFIIRSRTIQVMDYDKLIEKMLEYNSTITDADARAVLSVFSTMVMRYAGQGYTVKVPFGSFCAAATGTCANLMDSFTPGQNESDHDISIRFHLGGDVHKELLKNAEYDRIGSGYVQQPAIYAVFSLTAGGAEFPVVKRDDNGNEISSVTLKKGDTLRLRGEYIKVDAADTAQGIFLVNKGNSSLAYRVEKYTRNGSSIVDGIVPEGVEAGTYGVKVCVKAGINRMVQTVAEDKVIIG